MSSYDDRYDRDRPPPSYRRRAPMPPPSSPSGLPPMGRASVPDRTGDDAGPVQGRPASWQAGRDAVRAFWRNAAVGAGLGGGTGGGTGGGRHSGRGTGNGDGEGGLPRRLRLNYAWMARRRMLLAFLAVLIMLVGIGVVSAAYFVDGVKTAAELRFPETTTVYYSDGSVLSKLGEVTRYQLSFEEINDPVIKSIVASEDQTFWTNDGVDLGSVLRAAWNNFTGGETQGASTITQQYARLAFDLEGVTYQRKAREAVLAWKISDKMDKKEILESYLNAVPFGRQTYGIEAAAQAFFGKTAKKTAPPAQQLTWADAIALVAMVKQPYPNPDDPKGSPGYDPTVSPEAEANARSRFDYVRSQLVEMNSLSQAEADKLVFPKDEVKKYDPGAGNALEAPAGMVVNHVLSELTHTQGSPFNGAKDWTSIREGGYQIYTTLNHGAQQAAEGAADQYIGGSPMFGQPPNLQAALVAVQPGTGRVLAYFGGHDGKGADYGGFYWDEKGEATGVGRFPAGSSFKVYTLAAALAANYSLRSYWEWNPHDMPGRTGANRIRNASTCGDLAAGDPTPCTLLQSTISSLNVPFYGVTYSVGPANVLEMARNAGVDTMWTDARERVDLRSIQDMHTVVPSKFDTVLGIGQYPITVTDHANGLATIAAGGLRAQAHFVMKVMKGDKILYGERLPAANQPRIFNQQNSNDLTYALSQVGSSKVSIGWDTAGKTGTWEFSQASSENAHAWMVGFSKKIAAAVWVGNKAEEHALRDKNKAKIYGAGVPADVWRKFMTNATKAMNEPKVNTHFNGPSFAGDLNPPGSVPAPFDHIPGRDPRPTFPFPFPTRPPRG
jgi:membrane peptidoglycan carboxypeptidase